VEYPTFVQLIATTQLDDNDARNHAEDVYTQMTLAHGDMVMTYLCQMTLDEQLDASVRCTHTHLQLSP
jgi:hypothetical protein